MVAFGFEDGLAPGQCHEALTLLRVNATTDWVVRSTRVGMDAGPARLKTAITELVGPRSMPDACAGSFLVSAYSLARPLLLR